MGSSERRGDGATRALASFIAETAPADIPPAVLHQTKRLLVNFMGVALHATRDCAFIRLLSVIEEEGGAPRASVLGTSLRTSLQQAALANGLLAHLDDFDDTCFPTVLHPSAPTFPAALALGEARSSSGVSFLTAAALGLETCCRIASAVGDMRHAGIWHMTGTVGVFGSAAAAARLMALDAPRTAIALGLAGTQAAGLRETFGSETKSFHPGRAAQAGVLAALLAARGFGCCDTIVEGRAGFAAGVAPSAFDPEPITEGLGQRWQVMQTMPKPYASAILSHPMVDAMLALRARGGFDPGRVRAVHGRVNPLAIRLESRPRPASGLEARLSFQHAMAVTLVDGACLPAQFTDERVRDPVVASLRERISVEPDDRIGQEQCEIVLILDDGRVVVERIEQATGSPRRPMSDPQLDQKFRTLAAGVLSPGQTERVLGHLWNVDSLINLAPLLRDGASDPGA